MPTHNSPDGAPARWVCVRGGLNLYKDRFACIRAQCYRCLGFLMTDEVITCGQDDVETTIWRCASLRPQVGRVGRLDLHIFIGYGSAVVRLAQLALQTPSH